MAPTHVYSGGSCTYPQLTYTGGVAPFTVTDGSLVDFGDGQPPADGHWSTADDTQRSQPAQLPDNHPDVIAAADAAASAEAPSFAGMRKPQLVAECEARGLDTSGTAADLTARLTAFDPSTVQQES